MYFQLPGVPIERAVPMAGSLSDVLGSIALLCLRVEEAGADARDETFALRQELKDQVRQEMRDLAPEAADDVMRVLTEF
ncbi:hypothetical protein [Brachybacterium squillarum]|uniref:hypothetical protein n=1 Tax=Brachybacterium squillarum TaxID=661979 RepID=UPI0002629514|nr:hypothetical protein [Brachybacterium squillarum]